LPFLELLCESPAPCEWVIDDAELALEAVEVLPRLDAHVGVDWPKGTPVRVQRMDLPQLAVSVRVERDWFHVDGALPVDESHVLAFEQLLEAARGRSRYVAMGDGVYVALSRALKQRLADLDAVVERDRHGHRVAPVGAAWLRDLLDGAVLEADDGFRTALDALQHAQAREHAVPPMLQAALRGYQEDGYRWAMRLADAGLGGCLADDMGLGKTLQALAVLCARAAAGPALVVAPTSVCGNWIAEAARFAPSLRVVDYASANRTEALRVPVAMDVLVVSYALLLQDSKRFAAHTWHTLVLDEAQAIKNPTAKRSLALFELPARFRLALSGTPVENRLAELWSILRFTTPGLLGTLGRFNERFVGPIERDRDREQLAVLRRLVAPFVLRRTKSQVLGELPPRTETVINVVPEAREAAHYEALRRDTAAVIDRSLEDGASSAQTRFNILAQLMRLRRAACDPRLVSPEFGLTRGKEGNGKAGSLEEGREADGGAGGGEKVQVFLRLAADLVANGHKALVFSQFVDFLQLLRDALDGTGIRYQTLDGSTPAAERTRRVNAFQAGEGDLFLISLKAGGVGLNLTAADYVVITDPWWNPAVEDQATGRAHRIGQQRPVTVYRLVNVGTIEERIVDLHRDKREIAEGILETGEVAALPSTDVLIGLMRGEG
jgi:SNF2 family DNA or RNA helicase